MEVGGDLPEISTFPLLPAGRLKKAIMDMFMEDKLIEEFSQSVRQVNATFFIASFQQPNLACHVGLAAIFSSLAMLFSFLGLLSPLWWSRRESVVVERPSTQLRATRDMHAKRASPSPAQPSSRALTGSSLSLSDLLAACGWPA